MKEPSTTNNAPRFTPSSTSFGGSSTAVAPQVMQRTDSNIEQVDGALFSAVTNPRERMFLFQLEDAIAKFVQSSPERAMEIPPMVTSYRRMIAYRVAQRFNLTHLQSDYANEVLLIFALYY